MKKLSLLISLILCVTIGGVYATWLYTNGDNDITDQYDTYTIHLETAETKGAHGTFSIESNITKLSIDQKGGDVAADYHDAVLNIITSDGAAPYIKIILDLEINAPDNVFEEATFVPSYNITIKDVASQYDNKDIFEDKVSGSTEIADDDWDEESSTERIYSYTITNLEEEFVLNDFNLPSKADHTAFGLALGNPVIRIDVSDGKTAA